METRNIGSFAVTPTLIEESLHMPAGHEIVGAEWDFGSRTVRLFVEGPGMPLVERGQQVPSVSPCVRVEHDDTGKASYAWEWGANAVVSRR